MMSVTGVESVYRCSFCGGWFVSGNVMGYPPLFCFHRGDEPRDPPRRATAFPVTRARVDSSCGRCEIVPPYGDRDVDMECPVHGSAPLHYSRCAPNTKPLTDPPLADLSKRPKW